MEWFSALPKAKKAHFADSVFPDKQKIGLGGKIRTCEHWIPSPARIAVCGTPRKIGWRGRSRTCINFASSDSKSEMFPLHYSPKKGKLIVVMPKFTQEELENAAKISSSYVEVLRNLGMCETGNNYITLKKYISLWKISIEHFATASERARKYLNKPPRPLEEILIKNSTYNRTNLKKRLYEAGLKKPICELCGQDENWQGKKMSLILDIKTVSEMIIG